MVLIYGIGLTSDTSEELYRYGGQFDIILIHQTMTNGFDILLSQAIELVGNNLMNF